MIGLSNLSNFIQQCALHPKAARQTFVISDGEDLSTSDLLRRLSTAMDHKLLLLPVPTSVMTAGLRVLGRENIALRLFGDLQVNIAKARQLLAWQPPVPIDVEFARTAVWFNAHVAEAQAAQRSD
jgi:nucleoside-diphosphate-sugar epimerase